MQNNLDSRFMTHDSRIIAIDPGYERLGIAVMEKINGKEKLIYSSCFKTPKELTHPERLLLVANEIEKKIEEFKPEVLAIEGLFFSKNVKTAMLVAETRGVILVEASRKGLEIQEYMPSQIKMAVTGNGNSDKKSVEKMVDIILGLSKEKKGDDEYDAIAIGIACLAINKLR